MSEEKADIKSNSASRQNSDRQNTDRSSINEVYSFVGEPLLSDTENENSLVYCPLCISHPETTLHWCEYEPMMNEKKKHICDHCFLPPPNELDFVRCKRYKHLFCIYCVELKLFRIQLGLFVMDDDENLGEEWEKDYVRYRNRNATNNNGENAVLCGCIPNPFKKNTLDEQESIRSAGNPKTTRLAGYSVANRALNDSIYDIDMTGVNEKNRKRSRADSAFDMFSRNKKLGAVTVTEMDVDEYFSKKIILSKNNDLLIDKNTKKGIAIGLLIERIGLGNIRLPPAIIELDYDKYGVYCFTYVVSKLEQKQRNRLFMILEFISMVTPTGITIKLLQEFKKSLLMFPRKYIDQIFLGVIRGSKYSIATSLKVASIAAELGSIDLARRGLFETLSDKYQGIAIALIQQVESHHLASILLEAPSEIDGLSPLEIAFEYQMYRFLAQSKIQKISHQIWFKYIFLSPKNAFDVQDPNSWDILSYLTSKPKQFFFLPIGKMMTKIVLFCVYLMLFTFILSQRPVLFDTPTTVEVIFWFMNLGYIGYEFYECFVESGVSNYLISWINWLDMTISLNFLAQIVLRLIWLFLDNSNCINSRLAEWNYSTGASLIRHQVCPSPAQVEGYWPGTGLCGNFFNKYQFKNITLPGYPTYNYGELCPWNENTFYYTFQNPQYVQYRCDCWKSLDKYLETSCCRAETNIDSIIFNLLYGINAVFLWTRILSFFEQNQTIGPLLKVLGKMKDDVKNYVNVSLVILIGVGLAVRTVIGKYSEEFYTLQSTFFYMFQSSFLKINFGALATCGDDITRLCADKGWVTDMRSNMVICIMCLYLLVALLLIRLLIAMVTYTYNNSIKKSEHQVMYTRIKEAYELDQSSGLMPPPLNILVFGIGLIWSIMDILMVLLINRYIDVENQMQLAKPKGQKYLSRVYNGIRDLFNKSSSGYWICAYCKVHNDGKNPYNIEEYITQFKPLPDSQDVELVKLYSPIVCKNCYRNKYSVNRSTIVLEQISFGVFVTIVFPFLWLALFVPGLIKGLLELLAHTAKVVSNDDEKSGPAGSSDSKWTFDEPFERFLSENNITGLLKKEKKKLKKLWSKAFSKAEKVRNARQIQQLDAQLRANPDQLNSNNTTQLSKHLKSLITGFKREKHTRITPNINDLIDNVTSDKTPIHQVSLKLSDLDDKLNNLYKVIKASATMQVATTLEMANNQEDDDTNPKSKKKRDGRQSIIDSLLSDDESDDDKKKDDKSSHKRVNSKSLKKKFALSAIQDNIENDKPNLQPRVSMTIRYGQKLEDKKAEKTELLKMIRETQAMLSSGDDTLEKKTDIDDNNIDKPIEIQPSDAFKRRNKYRQSSNNLNIVNENDDDIIGDNEIKDDIGDDDNVGKGMVMIDEIGLNNLKGNHSKTDNIKIVVDSPNADTTPRDDDEDDDPEATLKLVAKVNSAISENKKKSTKKSEYTD